MADRAQRNRRWGPNWRLLAATLVAMALAFGTAGPSGSGESPASGTFVALSYNVAGLPEGLSGSNPSVNTPLISPLLNAYDLVLVQEDWADPDPPVAGVDFYHDDLISEVTHPYLSKPALPPVGTDPRRPTALVADGLNRLSRFEFGPVIREMWTNCFGGADTSDGGAADCLGLKGFSMARTMLAPGVEVDVYNLHGEAGGTALDEAYRSDGYEQLAAFIAGNSAGRAIIVGGDFNLQSDTEPDKSVWEGLLSATGLIDVCVVVDCKGETGRIDKFAFRSGGGVTVEALTHNFEVDVFQRSDGEPLSDHDALAVTFRWSIEAADSTTTTTTTTVGPVSTTSTLSPAVATAVAADPVAAVPAFTG